MVPVQLFDWVGKTQVREPVQQRVEGEPAFHASEGSAETEVDAVSEGKVSSVGAVDVEQIVM